MKSIITITKFLVLMLAGMATGFAQGPPIVTDTPIMLGLEGGAVRTLGRYFSGDNVNMYVHPIAIPYNITSRWQAGTVVPFMVINPKGQDNRSGIGDIMVFSKYQLMQRDGKAKTFRTLLKVSHTFSTGSTRKMPALGLGTSQTGVGVVSGYVSTRYGLYTEAMYTIRANGFSDQVIYNFALGVPLLPQQYPPKQVNVYLEVNGLWDDAFNNLFLSPGVQWIAGRKLLIEGGIQLPLHEGSSGQTNFITSLGTRILLF